MKIKINNEIFSNFSAYSITLKYNAIASSFRLDVLNNVLPVPLSYAKCSIYDDDNELLLTGVLVNNVNNLSATPELVSVSGYSKPGILEDCNIPTSLYPLQSDNLSLKQICDKILPAFDIDYEVDAIVQEQFNKTYPKSNSNVSLSIKDYINSLASQAGIIMTHTAEGSLFFTKLETGNLISAAMFVEGNEGIKNISLSINGQGLHSEITVLKQASSTDVSSGEETVKNPMVKAYRPKVKVSNSGSVFDTGKAARMELSAELSAIKFIIGTTQFIKPGSLVQFKAPSLKINNMIDLIVEQTEIRGTVTEEHYSLICVLRQVYDFTEVEDIFT